MKNKQKIIISIAGILVLIGGFLLFYFLNKEDKDSTLTLIEKQWIESNKNNVIDMSIINDIPILSYNGEGIIVDFLNSLKDATNLSFNKIAYNLNGNVKSEYAFKLTNEVNENDILIYSDNYVIVTKNEISYNSLDDLNNLKLGVLSTNVDKVNSYLYNTKITYDTFENQSNMIEELNKDDTDLDGIILLKTVHLKTIFNNNYHIAYNINEYTEHFVLTLGNTDKLNNILTKYYNKWKTENYTKSYNKYLVNNSFSFQSVNDSERVKFRSKRYTYGFVDNAPYDTLFENKLAGINNRILAAFSDFSGAEISYKSYNNIEDLLAAFNRNEIDFFYGQNADQNYALDVFNTTEVYDNSYVVLTHLSSNRIINSVRSIKNEEALVLKGSKLQNYLVSTGLTVKAYENSKQLLSNINKDSIIVMELNEYLYHVQSGLKDYTIVYQFELDNNYFTIRDISDNKVFLNLFNFFITFGDNNQYTTTGLGELLLVNMVPSILKKVAILLGGIVSILLITMVILKVKPTKNKKPALSKEDKLRYIDSLTSLKNRNYLNENMPKWDESENYPQTVIIIDLNNIAYINDNYGHPEGDAVIEQAANILILNQMENSEIIRTDGNEFLIYLVNYDEKQVITYMRKLSKELKELKHGFGAAIGYSIISDAIKTIDDAINEATLDMRNNKEELRD